MHTNFVILIFADIKLILKDMNAKTLINDNRLTPTMERVRSGVSQLFREKNAKDRTFIDKDNCDVILHHNNKAMYADLIDGDWYWVNGCPECNGEIRDWMTYVECDEHDRCSVCGTNHKDAKGKWGNKNGWICNTCQEHKVSERRIEAFEKLDGEEPNCCCSDEIICPHCGSEICSDELYESQDIECHVCDGKISLEVEYTLSYSTSVKGKRITE